MIGVLELVEKKGRRPEVTAGRLHGLRCLRAEVPVTAGLRESGVCRRVDRGARALARAGVRRVLTASDFPWWEQLGRHGLCPVETAAFCQALAAPLTLAALERRNISPARASVALWGPSASRSLLRAAEELCPRVRALAVDVPGEEERLASWLWREFGAAMVRPEAGGGPDVALWFGPGGPEGSVTLSLYGPRPGLAGLAPRLSRETEQEGVGGLELLSLLWEEGRLDLREIRIVST